MGEINLNKRKKRSRKNKPNPNKKKNKKEKNTPDNILDINNSRKNKHTKTNNLFQSGINSRKNITNIINEIKYPDDLNEEQTYELFLKIDKHSDYELNNLNYEKAIKIDKRRCTEYYISLVRTKHLLFYSFYNIFDYNSRIIKIYLFFFKFTTTLIVNALFFDDDTMHKIYVKKGDFKFINNLPQILYSAIISGVISGLISLLTSTNSNIIKLKQNSKKDDAIIKRDKNVRIIKIKLSIFFIMDLVLLIFFWFYLSCFCAVYKNTQIHLIKDTLISFATGMIYPFGIYILPGLFRFGALHSKKKDKECMFKFSKVLQIL